MIVLIITGHQIIIIWHISDTWYDYYETVGKKKTFVSSLGSGSGSKNYLGCQDSVIVIQLDWLETLKRGKTLTVLFVKIFMHHDPTQVNGRLAHLKKEAY